jgi:hypothetical protein
MDQSHQDLIIAVLLTIVASVVLMLYCYENDFSWHVFVCAAAGPIAGLLITASNIVFALFNLTLAGLIGWFVSRGLTKERRRFSRWRNLIGASSLWLFSGWFFCYVLWL